MFHCCLWIIKSINKDVGQRHPKIYTCWPDRQSRHSCGASASRTRRFPGRSPRAKSEKGRSSLQTCSFRSPTPPYLQSPQTPQSPHQTRFHSTVEPGRKSLRLLNWCGGPCFSLGLYRRTHQKCPPCWGSPLLWLWCHRGWERGQHDVLAQS